MKKVKPLLLLNSLWILVSCSSIPVKEYEKMGPPFEFENFFNGKMEATGFFQDRDGKVIKQIYCDMTATWNGDELTVDEKFRYGDGTTEERVWKIKKTGENTYTGTAGDVVGSAQIGTAGFAFNMNYILRLKVNERTIDVRMDDWMYRINDSTVINKTKMSKWGFHLGDVTLTIVKK